jgi:Sensors of blue-light using FAD
VAHSKQHPPNPRLADSSASPAQDFEIDQILYCSLAKAPMDAAALRALSQSVAPINRMDHITGLLMYSDGVFVQLFEGPPQAVQHLWARLLRDPRHYGIVQLYHYRELEQRTCQDWHMKLVDIETLRGIVTQAREEVQQGQHSVWAAAIERMDFLLSTSEWDRFVERMRATKN